MNLNGINDWKIVNSISCNVQVNLTKCITLYRLGKRFISLPSFTKYLFKFFCIVKESLGRVLNVCKWIRFYGICCLFIKAQVCDLNCLAFNYNWHPNAARCIRPAPVEEVGGDLKRSTLLFELQCGFHWLSQAWILNGSVTPSLLTARIFLCWQACGRVIR